MSALSPVRAAVRARRQRRLPDSIRYSREWEPADQPVPNFAQPVSQACTLGQIRSREYAEWCGRIGQPVLRHRKQWEWCFILQALARAGAIIEGHRGLGFGVGTEPLVPYLAKAGCALVATDLGAEQEGAQRWMETGQHASTFATLNADGLCPPEQFARNVTFRAVDMNDVPADLSDFDFTWSSCALEHLGDLDAGAGFFLRQIDCLAPGGVGVHTTEYNVSSNTDTVEQGHTVLYRRRDLERLVDEVRARGHDMTITFGLGRTRADRHIERPPWTTTHLKVQTDGFVATSFGLVVRKRGS